MFDNVNCISSNFPWDWFFFLLIPLLLLWWFMNYQLRNQKEENETLKAEIIELKKVQPVPAPIPTPIKPLIDTSPPVLDDLKLIEGIGPKIEKLLNDEGIYTFAAVTKMSVKQIEAILTKAGRNFQMHHPGTWPAQALLARDKQFEELKKWQDQLKGGRQS